MKNYNLKKLLSACAVLTISATAAFSAISFSACAPVSKDEESGKLITADDSHRSSLIATATGTVRTANSGTIYYVAPDGLSRNNGLSWDTPKDIASLLGAGGEDEAGILQPGDTVYVKPGNYILGDTITMPEKVNGTYNNYIRIVNAALEPESQYQGSDTTVTLNFYKQSFDSSYRGVQIYSNYVYWYGIDICGAGDNGLYIGGDYNTVEYSEFYNNRDTGLQLGRASSSHNTIETWPSYNLVKNCTSHNNYDNQTFGENADGFAAKLTVGYGNVFDGCIAYRNSDDGWDLYAKTDSGNIGCIIIYNCVAFENGFLEYTQEECNSKFPTYQAVKGTYDEPNTNSYLTRDGDGNGFKLGGSVMEGDVVMYNCLSFNNRMHGVTDNSNPGYLKVEGVTSYDNSAFICDTLGEYFGQIIAMPEDYAQTNKIDNHANIDVARQTYSYNSVIKTLSVNSNIAVKAKADAYRGSVTDSVLSQGYNALKTSVVKGSIDADTKNGAKFTEQIDALNALDIFETLPVTVDNEGKYTFNISGLNDLYSDFNNEELNSNRVHKVYRNSDMSINMKTILAKKEGIDDAKLIAGKNIGSTLNLTSWEDYKHFYDNDYVNGELTSANLANLARAKEALTINTDANAVYQDFEVPVMLNGCTVSWTSSDPALAEIGTEVEVSYSQSKYITVIINRPAISEGDKQATITATISYGIGDNAVSDTKTFDITVKAGQPSIGTIKVLSQNNEIISEGESYVVDWFDRFKEPTILVENGLDYNGKLLKDSQFTYETSYLYAADKNSPFIEIKGFTPSNAGVYRVTQTVTLTSDKTQTKSMSYTMYVASKGANVEFIDSAVVVNRDGYMISGNLTNATGVIYALSSKEELNITADNIKTYDGVETYTFRGDKIDFQFKNTNSEAYNIYYALANINGRVTTDIQKVSVGVTEISTVDDFMKLANTGKIGEESPATTIYSLTKDLDFAGKTWKNENGTFKGLLNGNGYAVKNITMSGDSQKSGLAIFYKTEGATIENIKFDNISITGGKQQVGIIASAYGGYYHNIEITNISITDGGQRSSGFIGHIFESALPTYISQVSVINDAEHKINAGTNHRVGGIVGFIQTTSAPSNNVEVYIEDCYVIADLLGSQQLGGIVGAYDNAKAGVDYTLQIDRCYFGGTCTTTYSTPRSGGIIGYESGALGGFTITRCISVGKLFRNADGKIVEIDVALKSASLIVGGGNTTATNVVKKCIAAIEEYDSDFDVEAFSLLNIIYIQSLLEEILGDGHEAMWKFVLDESNPNTGSNKDKYPYYLKAPFVEFTHTY